MFCNVINSALDEKKEKNNINELNTAFVSDRVHARNSSKSFS
jgi:hypothetical protein